MSSKDEIRVRFAPSPTGKLHIGNLRAAMFNWLFARHNKAKFLLRIEDTDQVRSKKEYTDYIFESLKWCSINYDEEPCIQSMRIVEHEKMIEKLISEGKAYRCVCTQEEIESRQKSKTGTQDLFSSYDGFCRDLRWASDCGKSFVVRFKLPLDQRDVSFDDLIRGTIIFDINQFDDFIIVRTDGTPVFNMVVVLDDAFMNVTHIIRGEDHIPNTPKHILLYNALGYAVPKYAHLPLLLGPGGDKLSKRDAAISVLEYKKEGFLADALFNYLVRLGWSHGDQEVFTREELVNYFSIDQIGKKGAIFDIAKLLWLNGVYIRQMSSPSLVEKLKVDLQINLKDKLKQWDEEKILKLVDLYKERVKTLKELEQKLVELCEGPKVFDESEVAKWVNGGTVQYLGKFIDQLENLQYFSHAEIFEVAKNVCRHYSIKLVELAQPIRIALTGSDASPGIFELLELVEKKESLKRLLQFLHFIQSRN